MRQEYVSALHRVWDPAGPSPLLPPPPEWEEKRGAAAGVTLRNAPGAPRDG